MSQFGTQLWREVVLLSSGGERLVIDAGDLVGGGLSDVTQRSLRGSGRLRVDGRECVLSLDCEDGAAVQQVKSWMTRNETVRAFCVGEDRHDVYAEPVYPIVSPIAVPTLDGAAQNIRLYSAKVAAAVYASHLNILLPQGWREFGNAAGTGQLDARWETESATEGMNLDAEFSVTGSVIIPDMFLQTEVFCPLAGYLARFVLDFVSMTGSTTVHRLEIRALNGSGSIIGTNTQNVSAPGVAGVVLTLPTGTVDVRCTFYGDGDATSVVRHPTLRLDGINAVAEY